MTDRINIKALRETVDVCQRNNWVEVEYVTVPELAALVEAVEDTNRVLRDLDDTDMPAEVAVKLGVLAAKLHARFDFGEGVSE